ncbi:unnamed protein product [Aspergillus oryzae var. brunneus]|uniref:Unnamed protein product n=2 Tax=Aspergillus oryzae TaxID=5062 RepID=A0AAN5BRD4_ASPOZ|nr:unnamed protein product [Aspergillus oryzae]GMG45432.1 unnamed protein product [Aspergillus oryzae var. brunneus]
MNIHPLTNLSPPNAAPPRSCMLLSSPLFNIAHNDATANNRVIISFLKQETLKQCATLLNLPSDFQRTLKDDLNGSSHTEYGFNGNEISQHSSSHTSPVPLSGAIILINDRIMDRLQTQKGQHCRQVLLDATLSLRRMEHTAPTNANRFSKSRWWCTANNKQQ